MRNKFYIIVYYMSIIASSNNLKKSTIKIKSFLDEKSNIYIKKNFDSGFVNKIKNIFDNIKETKIILQKKEIIKKINEKENYPLIYDDYKDKFPIFKDFLLWYRKNSINLDLKQFISKNKKINVSSRAILNKMLYDNNFVFLDIIHCSECHDLIYNEYVNENKDTNIYLFYPKDNIKELPDINLIFKIILFFRILSKKNMKVDLTIFYCDQKKYFPKYKLFTPENINSGCTNYGQFIYIWRKEELYKVLIHELTHYFSIDFHEMDNLKLEKIRDVILNIDGQDVVNETYTEIMAITINSAIYSTIHNTSFDEIINYEIMFTMFQIAKIINLFGGNKYDDLFNITINQTSSVISYIVVKGMLLNNYNIILNHFNNYFEKKQNEKFKNYNNIYAEVVNKDSLDKNLINHYLKIINENNDKNKFIYKTMKMVVFEL